MLWSTCFDLSLPDLTCCRVDRSLLSIDRLVGHNRCATSCDPPLQRPRRRKPAGLCVGHVWLGLERLGGHDSALPQPALLDGDEQLEQPELP